MSASQLEITTTVPSRRSDGGKKGFERALSFSDQDDLLPPIALLNQQRSFVVGGGGLDEALLLRRIKAAAKAAAVNVEEDEEEEEDLDEHGLMLPDNYYLNDYELDFLENITSCNKVENCVMLSEFEQNLLKETEENSSEGGGNLVVGNQTAKKSNSSSNNNKKWGGLFRKDEGNAVPEFAKKRKGARLGQLMAKGNGAPPKRCITVIEENSV